MASVDPGQIPSTQVGDIPGSHVRRASQAYADCLYQIGLSVVFLTIVSIHKSFLFQVKSQLWCPDAFSHQRQRNHGLFFYSMYLSTIRTPKDLVTQSIECAEASFVCHRATICGWGIRRKRRTQRETQSSHRFVRRVPVS